MTNDESTLISLLGLYEPQVIYKYSYYFFWLDVLVLCRMVLLMDICIELIINLILNSRMDNNTVDCAIQS